ncbi:hypothetical protein D3C81_1884920 [compost metagenome]
MIVPKRAQVAQETAALRQGPGRPKIAGGMPHVVDHGAPVIIAGGKPSLPEHLGGTADIGALARRHDGRAMTAGQQAMTGDGGEAPTGTTQGDGGVHHGKAGANQQDVVGVVGQCVQRPPGIGKIAA